MKKFVAILLIGIFSAFTLTAATDWYTRKFPTQLIKANGRPVNTATALKGKMVAVYFSASWCGPCRGFTPQLVKFYKKAAKKNNIEIVFVSSDKNSDAMKNYMKEDSMPWLAVPFNSIERKTLQKIKRVGGIPNLTVFDANGKLISVNARWDVVLLGEKAIQAWKSPNYKPKTYDDYQKTASNKKNKKNKKQRK